MYLIFHYYFSINMEVFQFKPLFEIKLFSKLINDKKCDKVVKILQGTKISKRHDIDLSYNVNRLEIRVSISSQVSIAVVFNYTDFQWLMSCIKYRKQQSVHVGKKVYVFNDLGDDSYTVCSVDNDRLFGIQLTKSEVNIIVENEKLLEFLLKHQNVAGNNLKELTVDLYTSEISKEIKKELKNSCEFCQGKGDTHICNKYFKDITSNDKILDKIRYDNVFIGNFNEKFNQLMTVLNVSSPERVNQTQFTIPEFQENRPEFLRKVCNYIDLNQESENIIDKILDLCYKN